MTKCVRIMKMYRYEQVSLLELLIVSKKWLRFLSERLICAEITIGIRKLFYDGAVAGIYADRTQRPETYQ